jgi:hypothetical protein
MPHMSSPSSVSVPVCNSWASSNHYSH